MLLDGAFVLTDSDKVSDSDNITVHSHETHSRIESRIGIAVGQCAHSLSLSVNKP